MSLPTHLPGCGEPAIAVFEIFTRTGVAYSLDGRLNVCGAHVVPALTALRDASYEPHQATGGAGVPGRCGDGYDYVARTALTAPAREGTTMTRTVTTEGSPTMSHLKDLAIELDQAEVAFAGGDVKAGHLALSLMTTMKRHLNEKERRMVVEVDHAEMDARYAKEAKR